MENTSLINSYKIFLNNVNPKIVIKELSSKLDDYKIKNINKNFILIESNNLKIDSFFININNNKIDFKILKFFNRNTTIKVGGLPLFWDKEDVSSFFKKLGKINDIIMFNFINTNKFNGSGIIKYDNHINLPEGVVEMDGIKFSLLTRDRRICKKCNGIGHSTNNCKSEIIKEKKEIIYPVMDWKNPFIINNGNNLSKITWAAMVKNRINKEKKIMIQKNLICKI